jgi:YYY domain-containing protein
VAEVVAWLLALELLGLLAFPLAFVLFRRLPDRGFTLAKPLALLLFAYAYWLLGLSHLAPNSRWTIVGILAVAALPAGWLVRRRAAEVRAFLGGHWRLLLAAEAIFLGFFILWLAVVAQAPAINHTEKPMDFAFLNAILRSAHFPPEDPWLAGHPISYYYFGHFIMAFLIKFTGISSSVGYNLAVALVPALTAAAAFGLLHNLVRLSGGSQGRALGFGLLAPALVVLVGNLEGVLELVHAQGWGSQGFWEWASIKGLSGLPGLSEGGSAGATVFPEGHLWWWRATRVIDTLDGGRSLDYTITEFPFFSFLLGDLHPHVMALPFLLLALTMTLNLFLREDAPGPAWLVRGWWELAVMALCLGALAFINAWDFPVLAAILGAMLLVKSYSHRVQQALEPPKVIGQATLLLTRALWDTAVVLLPVLAVAVFLFLPFYRDLSSQAAGVMPLVGVSTRPLHFLLVMGLLAFLGGSLVLRQLAHLARPGLADAPVVLLLLVALLSPFLLWASLVFPFTLLVQGPGEAAGRVGGRFLLILPALVVAGIAAFSAFQRVRTGREPAVAFPLVLVAAAFCLLVGAELFRLVDLFSNRMNTVFKLYYQAWLLLALAGAYGIYYWHAHRPQRAGRRVWHYAWVGAVALLVVASLYYPLGAALDRTGLLASGRTGAAATLDGLAFLSRSDLAEYRAIQCLRDRAPWGRLVEAIGDDYSDHGRISASTGLPTLLGWPGHELQWRGNGRIFAGREQDVARIYQSDDPMEVRRLLDQYGVRYVYLGSREGARYGDSHLGGFDSLLRTAFAQGNVIVYEMMGVSDPLDCPP